MAMLAFSSCNDKKDSTAINTDVPTTTDGAQQRLTMEEQVEKLNSIGQKILGQFKTQEQEDLVRLTDYLTACFENANWSAVLDSAGKGHAAYPGLNPNAAMATMRRLSANIYYAPMDIMGAITPDNWYLSDFYGEFEYIDSDSKWRYIADNDNAAIFHCSDMTGKKVVITIKATGDTYSLTDTVEVYNEKTGKNAMQPMTVHVPERIEATLNDNGTELINIALTFDINRKDHFKVAGNVRLANVIQTYDLNITRNAARGNYEMTVNGKSVCKLSLDNSGFNALAIDPNNNLATEGDLNKYGQKLEKDFQPGKTNALLTLLGGEMSIKGEMDGDKFYSGLKKLQEKEYSEQDQRSADYAQNWNDNIYMFVYYGSDIRQAQIKLDVDAGNVVPVIFFIEDKMAMQFDDFFTRSSYGDLIESAETLINSYIVFFEEHKVEPVDF